MNGNNLRQKNGTINEPSPPNAWRILDRKPNPPNNIPDDKAHTPKLSQLLANNASASPSAEPTELVNLAHKVNIAERLKRQKEKQKDEEVKVVTDFQTEEDILKKLLGVGQSKPAQTDSKPVLFPNNTQQVDLNALFGKANLNEMNKSLPSLADLPKPPSAWHQRSNAKSNKEQQPAFLPPMRLPLHQQQMQFPMYQQHQQQHPQQQHQPQFMPPQFSNNPSMNMIHDPYLAHPHSNIPLQVAQYPMMTFNRPPQQPYNTPPQQPPFLPPQMYHPPIYGQSYPMPLIPHGPPPFMNTAHQIRMSMPYFDGSPNRGGMGPQPAPVMHKSPEGPQKLKTKTGAASAFIPLQAARKVVKGKSNDANTQPPNDSTNNDTSVYKANDETPEIVEVKLFTVAFCPLLEHSLTHLFVFFHSFCRMSKHNPVVMILIAQHQHTTQNQPSNHRKLNQKIQKTTHPNRMTNRFRNVWRPIFQ